MATEVCKSDYSKRQCPRCVHFPSSTFINPFFNVSDMLTFLFAAREVCMNEISRRRLSQPLIYNAARRSSPDCASRLSATMVRHGRLLPLRSIAANLVYRDGQLHEGEQESYLRSRVQIPELTADTRIGSCQGTTTPRRCDKDSERWTCKSCIQRANYDIVA